MRLLLAIFLPFVVFFTIGRPWTGILCLFLQIFVIGWPIAAIWAVYALNEYNTDQKVSAAKSEIFQESYQNRHLTRQENDV